MQLNIRNAKGESSIEVGESVFGASFNEPLVHQAVTAYLAGARAGTRAHKTRSQVSGGGAKPWRQKGTGRARAGSSRGPIWRGGGKTFAAIPVNHSQKLNRKMYRGALRSILSELVRQERLTVVDELPMPEPKTKALLAQLASLDLRNVLIIVEAFDESLALAARNLHDVDVITPQEMDPVSLVSFDDVLCTVGALRMVEERAS